MDTPLLVAIVGLVGALVGSVIGGLISFLSTRSVRRMEWRQSLVETDLRTRENLYADFLSEVGRLMLITIARNVGSAQPPDFSRLVTLESKIWFHSEPLGKLAREIARVVLTEFSNMTKTEPDKGYDPLQFANLRDKFIVECKLDLRRVRENA
jgi:hypothetical protein